MKRTGNKKGCGRIKEKVNKNKAPKQACYEGYF
jgi:hypothetical protein